MFELVLHSTVPYRTVPVFVEALVARSPPLQAVFEQRQGWPVHLQGLGMPRAHMSVVQEVVSSLLNTFKNCQNAPPYHHA